MMNKKGVSAVIANVLIVLLVVAAIAILWAVIRPTIEGAGEEIASSTTCQQVNVEVTGCTSDGVTVFRGAGGPSDEGTGIVSVEGEGTCEGQTNALLVLGSETIVTTSCGGNPSGQVIRTGLKLNDGTVCESVGEEFTCP